MKRLLLITILLLTLMLMPSVTFAQGMMGNWTGSPSGASSDNQTAQEEAEGKAILDKLQSKQLDCKGLIDDNFEKLGDYFMGQMVGSSHSAMDKIMTQMVGEEGNTKMHIAMGKRLSGCDPNAASSSQGYGFLPMMWMMTGGGRMGGWNGFGDFGILTFLFWLAAFVDLILVGIWLWKQIQMKQPR